MNILNTIPPDKARHFIGGTIVAVAFCLLAKWTYPSFAVFASILGATLAGVLKEGWDWYQNRRGGTYHVEWQDAAATALGAVPVVVGVL